MVTGLHTDLDETDFPVQGEGTVCETHIVSCAHWFDWTSFPDWCRYRVQDSGLSRTSPTLVPSPSSVGRDHLGLSQETRPVDAEGLPSPENLSLGTPVSRKAPEGGERESPPTLDPLRSV